MPAPELFADPPVPGGSGAWAMATLAVPVATTPAPGTQETWQVTWIGGAAPADLAKPGQFRFVVDGEICLDITGSGSTTRTVLRAVEGPASRTHAAGASLFHLVTKGSLAAIASLNALGAHLNTFDASKSLFVTSPRFVPIPWTNAAQFVATDSVALLDLRVSMGVGSWTGGGMAVNLFYADAAAVPSADLFPHTYPYANDTAWASISSSVTELQVGKLNAQHGTLSLSTYLTGLTPGRTYRYQACLATIGASSTCNSLPSPWRTKVSQKITANPDFGYVVAQRNNGYATLILSRRWTAFSDRLLGSVSLVGSGYIAISPNGQYAVTGSLTGSIVYVISTGAFPASVPGLASPGAAPYSVAIVNGGGLGTALNTGEFIGGIGISPDGTRAWCGFTGTGSRSNTIQPLTLPNEATAGAIGWATPGSASFGAGSLPNDVQVDAAGAYAYVCLQGFSGSTNVVKVNLATGAIAATGSVTSTPVASRLSPDGSTLWVLTGYATGNAKLTPLATANLAASSTYSAFSGFDANLTAYDMAIFADGYGIFVFSATTPNWTQYDTQWNSIVATGNAPGGVIVGGDIDQLGNIYMGDYNRNQMWCLTGAQSQITPSQDFYNEGATIRVLPAA